MGLGEWVCHLRSNSVEGGYTKGRPLGKMATDDVQSKLPGRRSLLCARATVDAFYHLETMHLRRGEDGSLPWSVGRLAQRQGPNLAGQMRPPRHEPLCRWLIGVSTPSSFASVFLA